MSGSDSYKKAYERQKAARERAEGLLEERSRELYDANETLKNAYNTLKEQKAQLVQQEKLASIGLLAAGIAHEINNPVGYIKSNLQTLMEYETSIVQSINALRRVIEHFRQGNLNSAQQAELTELDALLASNEFDYKLSDGIECIHESLSGVSRIEDIIANLSDFAREGSDSREACNLNELIENALKLVWNKVKYKCDVQKELGELPMIYCWPNPLTQVFANIIVNAAQATREKGTLTISTSVKGNMVQADIVDQGPGIPEENLNKLFDPFFTTKEVGSGTGLGLYVSHGIVKRHLGKIFARNEPGGGARFSILLPVDVRKLQRTESVDG